MINPLSVPQLNLVNPEAKAPPFYQVVISKDESTSVDFLAEILNQIFFVTNEQASDELSSFNKDGRLVCGIYTYDVAESKLSQLLEYVSCSRRRLHCSLEVMN
ncbi:MAG: ATP-dependent Clp protease adaptor ClpS [Gammaproteobacteria bacterium]|nr:ATP-dependent Clp protease adaptor ClpS [Gammaproteobacteria bacterium]